MPSVNIPFLPGDKVVAYLRDSGGDEQDLSIEQQKASLTAWCAEHELILTQFFIDSARPGSSAEKREAFQDMFKHFHEPHCPERGVIVWSLSRFSRNSLDAAYYKSDLRRRHFSLYSITEDIPDTPEGRLIENVFNYADEKTLEKSSAAIIRGLAHNAEEYGAVPGTPPFGFKKKEKVIGIRRNGLPHLVYTWVVDPDQAPIVLAAFKMRAANYSIQAVNDKYHIYNHRTSYTTFFRNRLYLGELKYGDYINLHYADPIIPLDIWNQVQALNVVNRKENNPLNCSENKENPRRTGGNFILSGIAFCARCGSILNGQVVQFKGDKNFNYYICTGHARDMTCDAPKIPQQALEASVIDSVTDYIHDPNMLLVREEQHADTAESIKEQLKASIKMTRKSMADKHRRLTNLTDRIADDPQAPASIMDTIRNIEAEILKQQGEVDRLESRLNRPDVCARTPEEVAQLSDKLLELVTSNDPTERRTIIRLLVSRVDAERAGNTVRGMVYFYDEAVPQEAPPDPKVFMPT